ncbi:MAG TPA: hypothetical protein VNJ70_14400 [Thermoanaerobaculia bacterium]|nr:hypothetical protein [Thermoanaerobaculia bacterium]
MAISGSTILESLTRQADALNLVAATVVAISALILWHRKPDTRAPLLFWMLQWFVVASLYVLRWATSPPQPVELVLVDLQSILVLGFCIAFYSGTSFRAGYAAVLLVALAFFLVLIDVGLFGLASDSAPGSRLRYFWVGPSACLASLVFFASGVLFLLRFGWRGAWFTVASVLYAVFQWPVYISFLVKQAPVEVERWLFPLVLGKVILGGLFYMYWSLGDPEMTPLNLIPQRNLPRLNLKIGTAKLLGYLGSFALAVLVHFLATWLFSVIVDGH